MVSAENMFTSEEEAWCKLVKFRQIPFHYKEVQELHFFWVFELVRLQKYFQYGLHF